MGLLSPNISKVEVFPDKFVKNEKFLDNDFFDEINNIYEDNKELFENKKIKIINGFTPKPNGHGLGVHFKDILSKKFQYNEKINTMISTNNDEIKLKWQF